MEISVHSDYAAVSSAAANHFAQQIHSNKASVIGLATGSTPIGLYARLIEQYRKGQLSLAHVTTFNLDEYVGIPEDHPQSYHVFMKQHLFGQVDIPESQSYFPVGDYAGTRYDEMITQAGGLDLQVLGIGANGHIGFNEPGSSFDSRTREVELAESTITDNARFFDDISEVPRRAVTMGIATIMEARHILLIATGQSKAEAIAATLEKAPSMDVPASCLQRHPSVHVVLDSAAASQLS